MLSAVLGRQYDGLNSLAIACLIILLISPFQLFSVGFILSFCVVFSIFCFEPIVKSFLVKFLPDGFSTYLSVVLSAQIGSVPIVAYYFNTLQLGSVMANVLSVFIATIIFSVLFFCFILSLVVPAASSIYVVPGFGLDVLRDIAIAISNLDLNIAIDSFSIVAVCLVYFGMILSGEYSFIKKKWIYITTAYLFFIFVLILWLFC